MGAPERIRDLNAEAGELDQRGNFRAALRVREDALNITQRAFGNPSPEADAQKFLLCRTILLLATTNAAKEEPTTRPATASSSSMVRPPIGSSSSSSSGVCSAMTVDQLLIFAERLLGPGNTLAATQQTMQVVDLRGKILLATAAMLRGKRPRAALPMAQQAIALLRRAASATGGVSIDVVTSLLTMCALQSAAKHHEDALRTASEALELASEMDAQWRAEASKCPPEQAALESLSLRRSPFGELQVACFYDVAAEQEHLGLFELALSTYQRGFEIAFSELGETHHMSMRLKRSYAEIFTSLHMKHFAVQKPSVRAVFGITAENAVDKLNASYVESTAHRVALLKDAAKAQKILCRALPTSSTVMFSKTQLSLRNQLDATRGNANNRPQSAHVRRAAAIKKTGGCATPTMSRLYM